MAEADIRAERIKKIDILKEAGMEAYPVESGQTHTFPEFTEQFETLVNKQAPVTLAGRVMSVRGQGGIVFVTLFDGTARGQIVVQKEFVPDALFELFGKTVDMGDFIEATGVAFTTKRGTQSLQASSWKMLTKSILPLPDEWYGIKDLEARARERYLDILLNPEERAMLERRSKFWVAIRSFLHARSFMEVDTPVFESTPGGADARPFITHHNALDVDVYMRISLELWQKRLLVAGFPKVFEIGHIFRNEGQSREHLQGYLHMETYEAFSDMKKGMRFIQDMYRHIAKEVYGKYTFTTNGHTYDLADEWKLIDYRQIIQENYGIDPITCTEEEALNAAREANIAFGDTPNKPRAIDHLWKKLRKQIAGPAFLINQPKFLEPLAKSPDGEPELVERAQVILAGSEMGKGFSELNDPIEQYNRFAEQQAMRDAGDDEAQRLDTEFVRALEYGMPPAFGFGVSERLFSFLEDRPIHEGLYFQLLKPKDNTEEGKSKQTKVAAVVLNTELLDVSWKELNTTAHLAASFAARQGKGLFMQDTVATKDGVALPLNMQHAIMIKCAPENSDIRELLRTASESGLTAVPFTQEMLETSDDKKVAGITKKLHFDEVRFLGVLLFGEKKVVDMVTERFALHK